MNGFDWFKVGRKGKCIFERVDLASVSMGMEY